MLTAKLMWNSVISTPGARYAGMDIKNIYLGTPMDDYEYMKMPLKMFPEHVRKQYNLLEHEKGGYVYLKIRRAIYGLPQAGRLANQQLKEFLKPHGYYKVEHTPGLWQNKWRPSSFTLVVDNFGVKYVGKEHALHLLSILEAKYPAVATDWEGKIYCGITLEWNYDEGCVDKLMPGYIKRLLAKFKYEPKIHLIQWSRGNLEEQRSNRSQRTRHR